MKKILLALLAVSFANVAMASTDPRQVDALDTAREGNLSSLVLDYFKKNLKVACDDVNNVVKFEITKVASDSANQDKKPGTLYDYKGTYLVVEKCLFGSTYAGAYSEPVKGTIVQGSFSSKYNAKNGPAKMEDLKFQVVRDVDLSIPASN
ncbi:MAG: hypothetical protein ACXWQO_20360 [Bdellovibrionota bacterium]